MELINKFNWLKSHFKIEKDLLNWILLGLLIRVLLMPFAAIDIDGIAFWSNSIYTAIYPPLTYYYFGDWTSLLNFVHLLDTTSWGAVWSLVIANKAAFPEINSLPEINRTLFLLKFPYLIFDLSIAYLLVQMVENNQKRLILVLYFLNPITLFVSYLQGQFDIIPTFFTVLALYYAKKSNEQRTEELNKYSFLSVIALGVGASFKNYPFILLPLFVVFLCKNNLRKATKLFFAGILPYILSIASILIISPRSFLDSQQHLVLSSNILGLFFDVGKGHIIYIFLLVYFVLLILLSHRETMLSFDLLWKLSFVVLTLFYISSYWHPQWYLLIIPFTMLTVSTYPRLMGLYFIQMILYPIYLLDWGTHIESAFSVTVPFLRNLPGLKSGISQIYPFEQIYGIFFTVFVAVSLGMIVLTFKKIPLSSVENDFKKVGKKSSLLLIVFFLLLFPGLIGYLYTKDVSPSKAEPDSEIDVNQNTIVGQSFVSHYSNLRMIVVRISGESTVKNIVLGLRSDPSSTTDIVNTTGKESIGWEGDKYYTFDFSPLPDSKNKSYYFVITTKESPVNLKLRSVSANSYHEGEAYVNNKQVEGNLMFTTYFKAKLSEILDEEKIYIINLVSQDKGFFAFYFVLIIVLLYCLRWTKVKI